MSGFARKLIAWQRAHGRHGLPWQGTRDPYRIWLAEIMLQQTQVAAVIPYYRRFLREFPTVQALARAKLDRILRLWSGLGYYARARNLHRAAHLVVRRFNGTFPENARCLEQLPGIGRSTAAAIAVFAFGRREAILDGNARRVLARYFGVTRPRAEPTGEKRLWELAERCTPQAQLAEYTQAIMDLGATLCVRRKPLCARCPLASSCFARRTGRQHELPAPRRASPRHRREVFMVVALADSGGVLLERRPESGVWGGLWCLPEFSTATAATAFARDSLGAACAPRPLAALEHAFTHFDLTITPLLVHCAPGTTVMEAGAGLWYNVREPQRIGLPAPITTLLSRLATHTLFDEPPDR